MPFGFGNKPKAGSKRIGGVHVDATVDTSGVQTSLDEFETSTKKSTAEVDKSFSGMTERMQANVSKQTGVILGLIGSVTAVVGVFTLFVNVGKRLGRVLVDNTADLEAMAEATANLEFAQRRYAAFIKANLPEGFVGDVDKDLQAIRELETEIDALGGRLATATEAGVSGFIERVGVSLRFTQNSSIPELERAIAESNERLAVLLERNADIVKRRKQEDIDDELVAFIALQDAKADADRILLQTALDGAAILGQAERDENAKTFKEKLEQQQKIIAEQERGQAALAVAVEKGLSAAVTAGLGQTEAKLNRIVFAAERMAVILNRINGKTR